MSNLHRIILFFLLSFGLTSTTSAQTDPVMPAEPEIVQLPAADELILVGDYYALPDIQAPTVLLLHGLEASRNDWAALIQPLSTAGYNVLAVDLRGHGETGGEKDWEAAVGDVQTWLDWLREQPGVQASGISIIGADLSSSLAMIGCGSDSECVTAIALAPVAIGCGSRDCSQEIEGVEEAVLGYLDEALISTLSNSSRNILLLSGREDNNSIESIKQMRSLVPDQIATAAAGFGRAMELLSATRSSAVKAIVEWLDGHTPPNLTPEAIETLVAAGDPSSGETFFNEGLAGVYEDEGKPCGRCHLADSEEKLFAPGLLNVSERAAGRVDGQSAAVYLFESIVAPDRYVVEGFLNGQMPVRYDNVLTQEQIADLVAYLLTL